MKILRVRLWNYKSIKDSGDLFLDGTTILVGKNNAGKTALIEGIYRVFRGYWDQLFKSGWGSSGFKVPDDSIHDVWVSLELDCDLEDLETTQRVFAGIGSELQSRYMTMHIVSEGGHSGVSALKLFENANVYDEFFFEQEKNGYTYRGTRNAGLSETFLRNLHQLLQQAYESVQNEIIYISGDRLPSTLVDPNDITRLDKTAQNLHGVLHALQSNHPEKFDAIQKQFSKIFPDVVRILPRMVGANTNIALQFAGMREVIPLEQCGTGYTHVLITLCVALSDQRQIVLFDEPHVHLHPSAEKALYDVVAKDKIHQYIFTTHSPILLNYSIPKTTILVVKRDGSSYFEPLEKMARGLEEIGIAHRDYALKDRVLFVEGPTEEAILPWVLSQYVPETAGQSIGIIPLTGTGSEFASALKLMKRNASTYEAIFNGIAATPIPYRILLDSDEKKREMIREAYKDKVILLPRREIENYFLVPAAILAVLTQYDHVSTNEAEIDHFITECIGNTGDKKLYPKETEASLQVIVGSEVLERLFKRYTVPYSKVLHGPQLAQWIISYDPATLEELGNLLKPWFKGEPTY